MTYDENMTVRDYLEGTGITGVRIGAWLSSGETDNARKAYGNRYMKKTLAKAKSWELLEVLRCQRDYLDSMVNDSWHEWRLDDWEIVPAEDPTEENRRAYERVCELIRELEHPQIARIIRRLEAFSPEQLDAIEAVCELFVKGERAS